MFDAGTYSTERNGRDGMLLSTSLGVLLRDLSVHFIFAHRAVSRKVANTRANNDVLLTDSIVLEVTFAAAVRFGMKMKKDAERTRSQRCWIFWIKKKLCVQ